MSKAKDFISEVGSEVPEKTEEELLAEAKDLPQLVMDHAHTIFAGMESVGKTLKEDYLPHKFKRRVTSDYAGNKKKLEEIYKALTAMKNSYLKDIEDLRGKIVG